MVPGVVAMGIGLGACYPDFKAENPAQAVTSYGGFLFMVICAGYIAGVLILEAGPVYNLFMAELKNRPISILEWTWIFISFGSAIGLSLIAVFLPMKIGEKQLSVLVN
jgi:ABC-2 type transport system permease protein